MREAPERGYLFCITSGRMYCSVKDSFGSVEDVALFSCSNGGSVFAQGKPLPGSLSVPLALVGEIGAETKRRGDTLLAACGDVLYLMGTYSPFLQGLLVAQGTDPVLISSISELPSDPEQLTVVAEKNHAGELSFFKKFLEGKLSVVVSGENLIDMSPADKGRTVRSVCSYYDVPISHSVAFGDTENDVAMLRSAHIGYVMESGNEAVKKLFPHHTSDLERTVRDIMDGKIPL